ncbi:hypothetical protein Nepgr_000876 [Nepenthes gracilis]|uniref:Enhancer of polycomb-like protein n=1 Tax=Nepenthes gracilis TaxID=150966 RepID=A0AAD3P4F1_NEPGR|nr:hypothetical protein Nepgr_000876 [Nepenthes gracilis]
MEHGAGDSHGPEILKKSRSLDLRSLYDQKPRFSVDKKSILKRNSGREDETGVRNKNKKEFLLSSLSSGKRGRSSSKKLCKGGLSPTPSYSSKLVSGSGQKRSSGSGLGGISLDLNNEVICVPKRRRDLVRRKKFEVSHGLKQEATCSKADIEPATVSVEPAHKLSCNLKKTVPYTGDSIGKLAHSGESNGNSSGSGVHKKVKQKKILDGHKENRSNGADLLRHLKKEDACSFVYDGDLSSKKAKRNKKRKVIGLDIHHAVDKSNSVFDEAVRNCDDLREDDEENLEANAARMLSSRFDPSCTGFCPSSKRSKSPSADRLSFLVSSNKKFTSPSPDSRAESNDASGDTASRALRPRDQSKRKGLLRKRRHFYEVSSGDLDAYWLLNQRIKVFWSLDQSWCIGRVSDYDPEKKFHHIKYDDRDEEWIDLQNERFKLLLFPSEVPRKVGSKKFLVEDKHAIKGKQFVNAEDDDDVSRYLEYEPIISWLPRSTRRVKSSPCGIMKKQKTSNRSEKLQPSVSDGKNDITRCLRERSLERETNNLDCNSASPDLSADARRDRTSLTGSTSYRDEKKSPIVYFRRRFCKRQQRFGDVSDCKLGHLCQESPVCLAAPGSVDSLAVLSDRSQPRELDDRSVGFLDHDGLLYCASDSGPLKLFVPVINPKLFDLSLVPSYSFAVENLCLFHAVLMCRYGTMVAVWPIVHFEMFFVDSIVGLKFVLFEGCLRQIVDFVFLILTVFHEINVPWKHGEQHLPVTSIRFKISCSQDLRKQLVFAFHNFSVVDNSRWSYLDHKLKRNCLLVKLLPLSECTYDKIKEFRSGSSWFPSEFASGGPTSFVGLEKIVKQHMKSISSRQSAQSGHLNLSPLISNNDQISSWLPPFSLSFTAAHTYILSLHLNLLMEHSIFCANLKDLGSISLPEYLENAGCLLAGGCSIVEAESSRSHSHGSNLGALSRDEFVLEQLSCPFSDLDGDGMTAKLSHGPQDVEENDIDRVVQLENKEDAEMEPKQCIPSQQAGDSKGSFSNQAKTGYNSLDGIEIPPFDPVERTTEGGTLNGHNSSEVDWKTDGAISSPNLTAPSSLWYRNRIDSSGSPLLAKMSHVWPDSKPDFVRPGFGNRHKKPRTQVSYSLPFGSHDFSPKNRVNHVKGFSHKRIRKASEKRSSDASKGFLQNMELSSCDANVLVTTGDRGWRECGARIVLELVDDNEWRLAVKLSGTTKYYYKAHQFLQPGSTNRYTHAMMWKGGKDWTLEFPDRTQCALFKEMHEECYNRNMRAALVKNIPIPGVRLIEESDDDAVEAPFARPSSKYLQQFQTDVDMAMDPSRVLYDMDSDDELWLSRARSSDVNQRGCGEISDEMFENIMDTLEKAAYAKEDDLFTPDELEELLAGVGPVEAIEVVHKHWLEKRQKKAMPLIRHLQPPLWEKYRQQVKEWELAVMKSTTTLSNGCHEKAARIEKPPMFAFCLKPRGLEVPYKGSKQRSQKKLSVTGHGNLIIPRDLDRLHSFGGRLNAYAFGDEKVAYANHRSCISSPLLKPSTRVFSPRDAGAMGYFSLNSDASERNHYPKLYRNNFKKIGTVAPPNDPQKFSSYNQGIGSKRNGVHRWNTSLPEWPSPMHYQLEGSYRYGIDQLDASDIDELRLRDASSAAQHAVNMAKLKRERAQRLLYRADLAIHKAMVARMTAEAIKAASEESNNDVPNR